jgi:leucyl-tRNA---protein transferase
MIYYEVHIPEEMNGAQLDEYLRKGWYRMQQTIFTTDIIVKNDLLIPVFWLRLNMKHYKPGKQYQRICKLNKDFIITLANGDITDEVEQLYQYYSATRPFELSASAKEYLLDDPNKNIYPTKRFEIRDHDRLIAVGYFDEGDSTLAGILNIYAPDYSQFTLGKYLMLLKIDYALQQQKQFYYPGYISTAITKFDYKLFPDKEASEVYIRNRDAWVPWLSVDKAILEESLFGGNNKIIE